MDGEVRIFWSGGWDSTFRILELSQEEGLAIRPMHIRDHARKGMVNELSAMHDILPLVREISKAHAALVSPAVPRIAPSLWRRVRELLKAVGCKGSVQSERVNS